MKYNQYPDAVFHESRVDTFYHLYYRKIVVTQKSQNLISEKSPENENANTDDSEYN